MGRGGRANKEATTRSDTGVYYIGISPGSQAWSDLPCSALPHIALDHLIDEGLDHPRPLEVLHHDRHLLRKCNMCDAVASCTCREQDSNSDRQSIEDAHWLDSRALHAQYKPPLMTFGRYSYR